MCFLKGITRSLAESIGSMIWDLRGIWEPLPSQCRCWLPATAVIGKLYMAPFSPTKFYGLPMSPELPGEGKFPQNLARVFDFPACRYWRMLADTFPFRYSFR